MKLEDLAYKIAGETLTLLEKKYHYRVSEEHKKDIQASVRSNLSNLISEKESN